VVIVNGQRNTKEIYGLKMLEIILLVGYTIIFGGLYLIWKYWYIPKVDKFTRGKGWDETNNNKIR